MREPPFERAIDNHQVTLANLVEIAYAIEHESVRRYAGLVETMELRGEVATAAALRVMLGEARARIDRVARWASSLGQPLPNGETHEHSVPVDLWKAWDEVAGSALLTPYRAFAIAADSKQKAFSLYSYLAAYATDPKVRKQAEKMALEELGHASLMRRWRRQAWHRERRAIRERPSTVASGEMLHTLLARGEAEIRERHRAIAARLRTLGDEESARLLEHLTETPLWPAATQAAAEVQPVPGGDILQLLISAQEPLEAFSETLEEALRTIEGEMFAKVEDALSNVVARMSQLSLHTARRLQAAQARSGPKTPPTAVRPDPHAGTADITA